MPALSLVKTLVVLASLALVGLGSAGGQGPKGKSPLDTKVPESIEDLRALEKAVQAILPKVQASTVAIYIGTGQGSGVIISEDGYVLTAGHVSGKPGQTAWVIMPDGKKLKATTLGRNTGIDSGLVKITDEGKYPFLDMGKAASLKKGQWVVAVGHPGGFRLNRKPVVRLGRVIQHNHLAIQTDCTLVGGDSGGPLFDLDGKIIGIHSRIGTQITENVHVPVDTYKETWDRLAKAEEWGGVPGRHVPVQSLGGKVVFEVDGTDPKAPDKKGVLTSDDPKDKKLTESHHKVFNVKMSPGHAYTIDLVSKDVDSHVRLEDAKGK
jgi:serine protease Do